VHAYETLHRLVTDRQTDTDTRQQHIPELVRSDVEMGWAGSIQGPQVPGQFLKIIIPLK